MPATSSITSSTSTAPRRRPADKHDERRRQLAESALQTLGELGYARTSLREIANNSSFTHGVVHYYFDDKLDLIIYGVRYYKEQCVTRFDAVVADSTTPAGLVEAFADKLVETLREEAPMHRLWYDLRIQSMFEDRLREAVLMIDLTLEQMIWRVITRYAELDGAVPRLDPASAYALLDGVFQQALLQHLTGNESASESLAGQVHELLPLMLVAR